MARNRFPRCSTAAAALLAATLAQTGCQTRITDADIRNVEITEVRALALRQERAPGEPIVALIDARSSARFADGHIPGARNLHLPDLPARGRKDPQLDRYKHIIVYGENPATPSALGMTKRLMTFGYGGVRMFAGGMSAWREAGYPIEQLQASEPAEPRGAAAP